jgi:hypothetical protein
MDRQSISSPVFDDNDGANNYVTITHTIELQRAMQGAQSTLRKRIDNLATNIRQSKAWKRDYIDNMFDYLNKHMEELKQVLSDYKSSSPSSSSRRRRASRTSSECSSDASTIRPRPHLHGDHQHICDPHRHEGQVTSKHLVRDNDERHRQQAQG